MDEGRFTATCASRFWRVMMGIILEELLRDEALEAFKIWYQKEDKVPY